MEKYPVLVNGWNLKYEGNMTYYKVFGKRVEAICLFCLEDDNVWLGFFANGDTLDEAVESLDIMPFTIVKADNRMEAEKRMIKYMKEH